MEAGVLCKSSVLLLTAEPLLQAGLELTRKLPAPSSWGLGLKAWATRYDFFFFFFFGKRIGHPPKLCWHQRCAPPHVHTCTNAHMHDGLCSDMTYFQFAFVKYFHMVILTFFFTLKICHLQSFISPSILSPTMGIPCVRELIEKAGRQNEAGRPAEVSKRVTVKHWVLGSLTGPRHSCKACRPETLGGA